MWRKNHPKEKDILEKYTKVKFNLSNIVHMGTKHIN